MCGFSRFGGHITHVGVECVFMRIWFCAVRARTNVLTTMQRRAAAHRITTPTGDPTGPPRRSARWREL